MATLKLFWSLSDDVKKKNRIDSVAKLVKRAREEDKEKEYILERLVKGMSSSRSRKGFFVTLTELIRVIGPNSYSEVQDLVKKHLEVKGGKGEEGENAVGRLLVYGSIIRAGISIPESETPAIIKELTDVKRSYLSAASVAFLREFLHGFQGNFAIVLKALRSKLQKEKVCSSIDCLWTLLILKKKWPELFKSREKVKKWFGEEDIANESFFKDNLPKVLSDCTLPIDYLREHPGLKEIIKELCKKDYIFELWTKSIDPLISNSKYSHKVNISFIIFGMIVQNLSESDNQGRMVSLLTPNFIETSLNHLMRLEVSESDKVVLATYDTILKVAGSVPSVQIPLLNALLTGSGNVAFDKLTGGNVISRLSAVCSGEAVKSLAEIYKQAVLGVPDAGRSRTFQERVYAAQQLSKLIGHPALVGNVEWKTDTLNFLLAAGVFGVKKGPVKSEPLPWNRQSLEDIKNAFFKCLDVKERSFENTCKILKNVATFASLELFGKEPREFLSPQDEKVWKKMMETVKSISFDSNKKVAVFLVLFIHMGFHLLVQPSMARDALQDLHICYEKALNEDSQVSRKTKKKSENYVNGVEEIKWIEVVVDLLLSLLSQDRSVLRQVVNSVFALISPHITSKALATIVDVINPPEVEEDKDSEEDSDNELEMDDETVEQEDEEADTSEDEEDDDSCNEDMDADIDEALRNDVKSALGDVADDTVSDAGSIDMDDMDDEAMKRIDEALAGVFKNLYKKRKSGLKKKERLSALANAHFKSRALDLINSYVGRTQPSPPPASHVIYLISPLVGALEASLKSKTSTKDGSATLAQCIKSTLMRIANVKKPIIDSGLTDEILIESLKSFITLANSGSPIVQQLNHPVPLLSQLCNMILKISQCVNKESLNKSIFDIYCNALDDYFRRNHCLLPSAFFALPVRSHWDGMWELSDKISMHTFDKRTRQFRKTQGLNLLGELVKSPITSKNPDIIKKREDLTKSLVNSIVKSLNEYSSSEIKPRYLCVSLLLLKDIYYQNSLKEIPDWESVKKALESLRECVPKNRNFHDVKKAFNKIAIALKVKVISGSDKRKKSETNEIDEPMEISEENVKYSEEVAKQTLEKEENNNSKNVTEKKRKKPASKETLKKRKEKKKYQLEGQFQGVEMPSFAGVFLNDKLNFETHKETTQIEKKMLQKSPSKSAKKRKRVSSESEKLTSQK